MKLKTFYARASCSPFSFSSSSSRLDGVVNRVGDFGIGPRLLQSRFVLSRIFPPSLFPFYPPPAENSLRFIIIKRSYTFANVQVRIITWRASFILTRLPNVAQPLVIDEVQTESSLLLVVGDER